MYCVLSSGTVASIFQVLILKFSHRHIDHALIFFFHCKIANLFYLVLYAMDVFHYFYFSVAKFYSRSDKTLLGLFVP